MNNGVIGLIGGGGTGPELIESARCCIKAIESVSDSKFSLENFDNNRWYHRANIEEYNADFHNALKEFYDYINNKKGIILRGAIPAPVIYRIRENFDQLIKINPIWPIPELSDLTMFPEETLENLDLIVVRDNIEGQYHSKTKRKGFDVQQFIGYNEKNVDDLAVVAFELARKRSKVLHLSMKYKLLGEIGKVWERTFRDLDRKYYDVKLKYFYPGITDIVRALTWLKQPLDVIAGPDDVVDIIHDDLPTLFYGDLNLACSGNFSRDLSFASYQTVHGTQRSIAGKDKTDPIGIIHALSMALEYSFGMKDEARLIRKAVRKTLVEGYRTIDTYRGSPSTKLVGTKEMTDKIIENLT